jgi:Amino acid synthesis
MPIEIRKIVSNVEETFIEGGKHAGRPVTMVSVAAVVKNPWAGAAFVEDLRPDVLENAALLAQKLVSRILALMPPDRIEAHGKAAVCGINGEIEHASALIHTLRFGNVYRDAIGGTTYLSFTNFRSGPGANISIPMIHKSETGKRSHFITTNFSIIDAPGPDEIVVAIGAADGGRVHPRIADRFQDMKEMGISQ